MVSDEIAVTDVRVVDAELIHAPPMSDEPSWEELKQLWLDQERETTKGHFKLGIIAATVASVYGEGSIQAFAKEVKRKPEAVYRHLRVYRSFAQYFHQWKNLSWTHYVIASESGLDEDLQEELLLSAADNDWSTPQFKREVMLRRSGKILEAAPTVDSEIALALSEWKELKPKIERFARHQQFALLASDFINGVDDELDRPWESAKEFLERQIEIGARDDESLIKTTGFQKDTIHAMCDELVATGDYYYIHKGGETDVARGAKVRLIVPKDVPSGDAYESRRSANIGDWDFD